MKTKIFAGKDRGLSLVEALVGMTIFLIALGFMIPLLADNQLKVIKSEIDTGAISISQKILGELRQSLDRLPADDWKTQLPLSGTETKLPLPFPTGTDISARTASSKIYMTELGKTYSATITYCETPPSPRTTNCNTKTRDIKLQVNYNGQTIYTVETVYTKFE